MSDSKENMDQHDGTERVTQQCTCKHSHAVSSETCRTCSTTASNMYKVAHSLSRSCREYRIEENIKCTKSVVKPYYKLFSSLSLPFFIPPPSNPPSQTKPIRCHQPFILYYVGLPSPLFFPLKRTHIDMYTQGLLSSVWPWLASTPGLVLCFFSPSPSVSHASLHLFILLSASVPLASYHSSLGPVDVNQRCPFFFFSSTSTEAQRRKGTEDGRERRSERLPSPPPRPPPQASQLRESRP